LSSFASLLLSFLLFSFLFLSFIFCWLSGPICSHSIHAQQASVYQSFDSYTRCPENCFKCLYMYFKCPKIFEMS
jgi:hypothetical protein